MASTFLKWLQNETNGAWSAVEMAKAAWDASGSRMERKLAVYRARLVSATGATSKLQAELIECRAQLASAIETANKWASEIDRERERALFALIERDRVNVCHVCGVRLIEPPDGRCEEHSSMDPGDTDDECMCLFCQSPAAMKRQTIVAEQRELAAVLEHYAKMISPGEMRVAIRLGAPDALKNECLVCGAAQKLSRAGSERSE